MTMLEQSETPSVREGGGASLRRPLGGATGTLPVPTAREQGGKGRKIPVAFSGEAGMEVAKGTAVSGMLGGTLFKGNVNAQRDANSWQEERNFVLIRKLGSRGTSVGRGVQTPAAQKSAGWEQKGCWLAPFSPSPEAASQAGPLPPPGGGAGIRRAVFGIRFCSKPVGCPPFLSFPRTFSQAGTSSQGGGRDWGKKGPDGVRGRRLHDEQPGD